MRKVYAIKEYSLRPFNFIGAKPKLSVTFKITTVDVELSNKIKLIF
jgi:hypothetical protein